MQWKMHKSSMCPLSSFNKLGTLSFNLELKELYFTSRVAYSKDFTEVQQCFHKFEFPRSPEG